MTILFGPSTHLIQSPSAKLLNCYTAVQHLLDNTCLTNNTIQTILGLTGLFTLLRIRSCFIKNFLMTVSKSITLELL